MLDMNAVGPLGAQLWASSGPLAGIAIPQMGQNVQRRRLRAAVGRRNPAEDVLRIGFGIFDQDIKIAVGVPAIRQRVDQLERRLVLGAYGVFLYQAGVGELNL